MTPRRKKILWVVLAVALLYLGIQLGWVLRGPPPGMKRLLDALGELEAKPATAADWKAVSVEKSVAKISGLDTPMVVARNLRPVLEAEGNTSAQHVRVTNTRNDGILQTLVWSHKANNAFEFDWLAATVKRLPRPKPLPECYLCPEGTPASTRHDPGYLIGAPPDRYGPTELIVRTPAGKTLIPWTRPSSLMVAYFFREYRYAACLERSDGTHKIVGTAIIDIEKREVVGVVDMPAQMGRYPPLLIVDPKTDLLLCFDLDVAWIVCVDLRPARLAAEAAEKKPAAPDQNPRPAAEPKSPLPAKVDP